MPYLSIIIPAYNEEQRISETLILIKDYLQHQEYDAEVLVIDDGSKDKTVEVVKKNAQSFPQLVLVENAVNKGKGGVVKQGMMLAKGEWRLFMDADGSTAITELPKLLKEVADYQVIIGSRYLDPSSVKIKQPLKRRLVSRLSNVVIQLGLLPGIKDTQCGFKLFSGEAAKRIFSKLEAERWAFDVELLTIARALGYKIKEVPVEWYDAKQSTFSATKGAKAFIQDLQRIRRNVINHVYEEPIA